MASSRRPAVSLDDDSASKKLRLTMDDAIAAMELQHQLNFSTDIERRRNTKFYEDKILANHLEIRNGTESAFLRMLPPELKQLICGHVLYNQVLRLATGSGTLRLARSSQPHPFALTRVCRMLREQLLDNWRVAICHNPNPFLDFLEDIPGPWIEQIEVIGMLDGFDSFDEEMDVSKVHGHDSSNDCEVELEKYIRMVYPKVNLTFRAIDEYGDPF